jgi:hypothetical protein
MRMVIYERESVITTDGASQPEVIWQLLYYEGGFNGMIDEECHEVVPIFVSKSSYKAILLIYKN